MTTSADEAWRRVGRYISARIDELQMSKAELIRASGVSDKTLNGYLEGRPVRRVDKRRELATALGWTTDSIQRIRDGLEPTVVVAAPRTALFESRYDELLDKLSELVEHMPFVVLARVVEFAEGLMDDVGAAQAEASIHDLYKDGGGRATTADDFRSGTGAEDPYIRQLRQAAQDADAETQTVTAGPRVAGPGADVPEDPGGP